MESTEEFLVQYFNSTSHDSIINDAITILETWLDFNEDAALWYTSKLLRIRILLEAKNGTLPHNIKEDSSEDLSKIFHSPEELYDALQIVKMWFHWQTRSCLTPEQNSFFDNLGRILSSRKLSERQSFKKETYRHHLCDFCQKSFWLPAGLKQHMRIHTRISPYQCRFCFRRFIQSSHLMQHVRQHTGEKPYHCTLCQRHFRQQSHLDQHVRLHTGEKPYVCIYCTSAFHQLSTLQGHMARRHPLKKLPRIDANSE